MLIDQLVQSILVFLIFFGVPLIPLILLAANIGHWHNDNPDPAGLEVPNNNNHH